MAGKHKHLVIVGLGALGSHALQFSRELTVDQESECQIAVIDMDRVESKNIAAQFHTKLWLGKNKAKSLASAMYGMFGKRVVASPVRLAESNADVLLDVAKLVIDCTDNKATKDLIQATCIRLGIPCLHTCIDADATLARIVWTEHFKADQEDETGQATCEDGRNLPFYGMAGAMIATTAKRFLEDGIKESWQLTVRGQLVRIA